MSATATEGCAPSIAVDDMGMEAAALVASIWAAAADAAKQSPGHDRDPLCAKATVEQLHAALRVRLARSHPQLLTLKVMKSSNRALKRSHVCIEMDTPSISCCGERPWHPTRPALAREIARVIATGACLTEVPQAKCLYCALPLKIFGRDIATTLAAVDAAKGITDRSLRCAITEAIAAIFSEAEALRASSDHEGAAAIEQHSSVDAAWSGTSARGSGIAMNVPGKAFVLAAATRVRERLAGASAA